MINPHISLDLFSGHNSSLTASGTFPPARAREDWTPRQERPAGFWTAVAGAVVVFGSSVYALVSFTPDTPSAAVVRYYDALRDENWSAMWDMGCAELQAVTSKTDFTSGLEEASERGGITYFTLTSTEMRTVEDPTQLVIGADSVLTSPLGLETRHTVHVVLQDGEFRVCGGA